MPGGYTGIMCGSCGAATLIVNYCVEDIRCGFYACRTCQLTHRMGDCRFTTR